MSGRVIAAGTLVLLAAMLIAPAVWPSAPWGSAVRAASCSGASHDVQLTAPNASPRTGTPTTLVVFTVTYRDTADCPPNGVVAVVPGVRQATMTATRATWATGVTFRVSMRLPIGSWKYRFDASSGSGGGLQTATVAGPGTIVISAPSPTPAPTPKPTATPKPTPKPTPTSAPTGTPSPSPTATAGPVSPSPSLAPSTRPGASPSVGAGSGSSRPEGSSGPRPSDATGGAGFIDEPVGPGDGNLPGDSGGTFHLPGFAVDHEIGLSLATWLIAVTVGVVLFAATYQGRNLVVELPGELSVLVLKRRRGAARSSASPGPEAAPDDAPDDSSSPMVAGAPQPEAQARSEAPLDEGHAGRPPRQFDAPPAAGVERRAIAYQSVRLSGGADDLRSPEVSRLRRRDEVEIIGEEAGAVRVRTPDGLEGWVPRIVLIGLPAASNAPLPAPKDETKRPGRRRWRRPRNGDSAGPPPPA